jgi:MFS family permease
MLKRILGVIAGIVVAGATVFILEWIGHRVFPGNAAADDLGAVSPGLLAMVVAGWFLGPFIGGAVAARIADRGWAAWIVAAFILLGVLATVVSVPHPLWMTIAGVGLPLVAGWIASRFARPRANRSEPAAI